MAAATSFGSSRSRLCRPEARSSPAASASVEDLDPGRRDHPAAVGDADDQRPRAGGGGLGDGHVGQAHVGVAAVHAVLADRGVGAPVADALRHLGRERVGGVAEEEEVGGLDHRREPSAAAGFFQIETARPRTRPFKPAAPATGAVRDEEADMGYLRDGDWHTGALATTSAGRRVPAQPSVCRNWITADGAPGPSGRGGFRGGERALSPLCLARLPLGAPDADLPRAEGARAARLASTWCIRSWARTAGASTPTSPARPATGSARQAVPARGLPRRRSAGHQPGDRAGALGQGDRDDRLERIRRDHPHVQLGLRRDHRQHARLLAGGAARRDRGGERARLRRAQQRRLPRRLRPHPGGLRRGGGGGLRDARLAGGAAGERGATWSASG